MVPTTPVTPVTEDVLRALLSKITRRPPEKIHASSKLRADLGLDSMLSLELLVTLEEQYGLVIPQEAAFGFDTFGDLVKHVQSPGSAT